MSTVCCFNDYSFTADFEGVCCHHKLCSSLKIVVHTWSLVFSLKKKVNFCFYDELCTFPWRLLWIL